MAGRTVDHRRTSLVALCLLFGPRGDPSRHWPTGNGTSFGHDILPWRAGVGKLTLPDGGTYEGEFFNDEINGKGVKTFPNGNVYTGAGRRGDVAPMVRDVPADVVRLNVCDKDAVPACRGQMPRAA
eukprot:366357-Chlamydomonas_euryale.AAC.4